MSLALALILDAIFGEPDWLWRRLPHPAVLMGRMIGWGDARLNRGHHRRLKGLAFILVLLGLAAATGALLRMLPYGSVIEVVLAAILLAQKSLVQHVAAVAHGLNRSLADGRQAVAMIVGRDTGEMRAPDVARAAIESAAENLSDGVIAPAFWFLIGGLPGIMLYKMANTADSMIGHMTPRHHQFGWAAARIDDGLNLIPARLTALLFALAHGWLDPRPIWRDARRHRSPNAGWPEAALAPILNVALAGPRSYDGRVQRFPWVWPEGRRDAGPADVLAACRALWRVWGLMLAIALVTAVLALRPVHTPILPAAVITASVHAGTLPAAGQDCGGDFDDFLQGLRAEALAAGGQPAKIDAFLAGASLNAEVLAADRTQGVFRKPFLEFSKMLISKKRLAAARKHLQLQAPILQRAAADYGVPGGILMAFWGFETDFGRIQGDFNSRDALLTLAHDCRRPELFRPQLLAALQLHQLGDFPPDTTGAWAGEIGMVQMLPRDIIQRGIDGDGDGLILLKSSIPDALLSAANMLRHHGWRPNEPLLLEVELPDDFDWAATGLRQQRPLADWLAAGVAPRDMAAALRPDLSASVLLPQGRKGPAFLAFDNYRSLFGWNQSYIYVTTAAYFATLIEGAPPLLPRQPDPLLSLEEMKALQVKLAALGYDIGEVDGILGAGTRDAVQLEQIRLGLPADAWPDLALLAAL